MTDYAYKSASAFIGKKIRALELSGYCVRLTCADSTVLEYEAFDGGASCWCVKLPDGRVVT